MMGVEKFDETPITGRTDPWQNLMDRAAVEPEVFAIVEVTLLEAMRVIREAQPANTSRMTFEGGKRRALSLLRGLRREVRRPWTGGS